MGFSISFSLFFVVSVFYVVIVDVLTLLYRITGLTAEQAKFQVISMLTNSGFTTKESELIVDQPIRRRMARFIMLFGYIFSITIVSVFVNLMLELPSSEKEEVWPVLIVISSLFVVFIVVRRVPVVRRAFNSVAEQWGRRWMYGRTGSNMVLVQDEYAQGVIAMVTLNNMPSILKGKSVQDWNDANDHGVYVLYISRGDQLLMRANEMAYFAQGDTVTVFGRDLETIRTVFGGDEQSPTESGQHAPRPVSVREFLHEQDEKAAKEAAMQARAAEQKKEAVGKGAAKSVPVQSRAEQEIAAALVKSVEPAPAGEKAAAPKKDALSTPSAEGGTSGISKDAPASDTESDGDLPRDAQSSREQAPAKVNPEKASANAPAKGSRGNEAPNTSARKDGPGVDEVVPGETDPGPKDGDSAVNEEDPRHGR